VTRPPAKTDFVSRWKALRCGPAPWFEAKVVLRRTC